MAVSTIKAPTRDVASWEYGGDVNQIHWSSWTCPSDGVVIADFGLLTSGETWYYYILDQTAFFNVAKDSGTNADGTSRALVFPVLKGHVYKQNGNKGIEGSALYFRYYKFV